MSPAEVGHEYAVSKFSQPAGDFYIACMPATEVARIAYAEPRTYDPERPTPSQGLQRQASTARVRAIAQYCQTTDAAFPTAVILSLKSSDCRLREEEGKITFSGAAPFANIVDGQHRLLGLRASAAMESFTLPVVLLIDATPEQEALLFTTINGTQTKVPSSLIYDLFEVTESRSPQKTCHDIARAMNELPESPWYRRLKMLGRKSSDDSLETVTQGTFVRELLAHMTKDPQRDFNVARKGGRFEPFVPVKAQPLQVGDNSVPTGPSVIVDRGPALRKYFINGEDAAILKILLNVFSAQRDTWPVEWQDPDRFILTKSTGFMGTMWALGSLVRVGQDTKDLRKEWFESVFAIAKSNLQASGKALTAEYFSSSGGGIRELRDVFLEAVRSMPSSGESAPVNR